MCSILCDPMDYTVHGILQARILKCVTFPFSRGSSQLGIKPRFPTLWEDSLPAEPQGKPTRDLIFVIPEWFSDFPCFLQFKSEFCNTELMIWATVSSRSYFCWIYRASSSLAAKNIINLIWVLTSWWCPCLESALVLLEESACYDQCVLLAKLCEPLSCFILYPKAKLACNSRSLLIS